MDLINLNSCGPCWYMSSEQQDDNKILQNTCSNPNKNKEAYCLPSSASSTSLSSRSSSRECTNQLCSSAKKKSSSTLSLDTTNHDEDLNLSLNEAERSLEACHAQWVQLLTKHPNLSLAVLGGGIYGCHFANVFKMACEKVSSLKNETISAKIVIYEKDDALFSQASGKNSFRIHKGFHYPRSGDTRRMCYHDHNKFKSLYPQFFQTLDDEDMTPTFSKVFAVAKDDKTKVDYDAMRNLLMGAKYQQGKSMWDEIDGELWSREIRSSDDVDFKHKQMEDLGFNPTMIDGAFLIQVEPILYADKPRKWFTEHFTTSPFVELKMGTRVDRGDVVVVKDSNLLLVHELNFDMVLNCTYNQAIPMQLKDHKTFYDLCISVIVAEKEPSSTTGSRHNHVPAISFGIFDGPFPSLEPYDFSEDENLPHDLKKYKGQNLFQIFDVELSSVACTSDPDAAYELMKNWEEKKIANSKDYEEVIQGIWDKCEKYYPRLGRDFELAGTWFALKTKVKDENASRPLIVLQDESVDSHGRFIQVFSSKLTSIFEAEEGVLNLLSNSDTSKMDLTTWGWW